MLAERVGFEPTVEFPLHTLSKRARSTTPTSLRFRINDLRAAQNSVAQNPPSRASDLRCRVVPIVWRHTRTCTKRNCVRPSNLPRPFTAIWLSRRRFERDADLERVRALGTEEINSRLVIGRSRAAVAVRTRGTAGANADLIWDACCASSWRVRRHTPAREPLTPRMERR